MQQTLLDENQPRPAHIGVSAQPTRGGWALVIGGDARSGWLARRCARLHDDHDDLRDLDCGLYPVFDRLHGCGDELLLVLTAIAVHWVLPTFLLVTIEDFRQ